MPSRRFFLKSAAVGLTTAALPPVLSNARDNWWTGAPVTGIQVGLAGYTFHGIPLDQSIAIINQVGINSLSIKDFHLPLDASAQMIEEVLGKFHAAGIEVYAAGVIYMKTAEEVDRAFAYGQNIKVPMIIGVPNYELLPYVEKKVKETNIRLAIHNHGPEDKLYPGPKDVFDHVKNMDSRIGMCFDIGHGLRAGADPTRSVMDFGSRIFDLHIKDLKDIKGSESGIEVGRGVIDIPGLVRALLQIKFKGRCSIEFELPVKDPVPGIAESVGYFKGALAALS